MTSRVASSARSLRRVGLPTDLAGILGAVLTIPVLGAFVGFPLVWLAAALGPPGAPVLGALVRSVLVASASTLGSLALALALAYGATRAGVPGRRVISLACLSSLFAPPFLAALALQVALGPVRGFAAVIVAQVLTFLPYAYLLVASELERVDGALDEAAESLGAGGFTVFRRITLALLRPRLVTTALIVFALALGDFANPFLLAGDQAVLSTLAYQSAVGARDAAAAASPAVLLLVPGIVAALVLGRLDAHALPLSIPTGHRTPPRPAPALVRWPLGLATLAIAAAFVAVPSLVMVGSVTTRPGGDWSPTLVHWGGLAAPGIAWSLATSVGLGLAAGLAGLLLALAAAHAIRCARLPTGRKLWRVALVPAVLPGPVVGVAYLHALGILASPSPGMFWILVAAVVFGRLPTALRTAVAALERVEPAHEEIAVSLGAGVRRTYARVFAPRLQAPACALFLFFFVEGVVSVGAVAFLAVPGLTPGAVTLLERVGRGELGGACALAAVLLAIVVAAVASARALGGVDRLTVAKL